MIFFVDGNLVTIFAYKLTNGNLGSVSHEGGATAIVETFTMFFQKMEIDATAGGSTVATSFNLASPVA